MKENRSNKKVIIIGIAIILGFITYIFWEQIISTYNLLSKGSLDDVVMIIRNWGIAAPIISIFLMVLQAFIAPIPAILITGANGVVFGFLGGVIISWIGAMIGAAGTFYLSRILGMDYVKKLENNSGIIKKVDEISTRHGTKVIFIGRLLPFVSFDFLSYAAGLSSIRPLPFFIATGIGMLPGTIAYVLLGNQIVKLSRYSKGITILAFVGIIVVISYNLIKKKHHDNK